MRTTSTTCRKPGKGGGTPRGSGFSLVEVMVTMVILSITSGIVLLMFKSAFDARDVAMARLDVAEKTRSVLQVMAGEISSAYINDLGLRPNAWREGEEPNDGTGGWEPYPGGNPFRWLSSVPREYIPSDPESSPDDEDGDGMVDEVQIRFSGRIGWRGLDEFQFGFDEDGDGQMGEDGAYLRPPRGGLVYDVGIDADNDGKIDEDGIYPADMLNFCLTKTGGSGRAYDIMEVGYAIGMRLADGTDLRTRLFRRAEVRRTGRGFQPLDGQFLVDDSNQWFDGNETDFTTLYKQMDMMQRTGENEIDVLGFDVVGMEIYYWYYNYAIAQELSQFKVPGDPTSGLEKGEIGVDIDNDADGTPNEDWPDNYDNDGDGRIDEDPDRLWLRDNTSPTAGAWRQVRGNWESSVECYPNEPEDIVGDLNSIYAQGEPEEREEYRRAARKKGIERMDGLPEMVEIRLYVLDRERNDLSVRTAVMRVTIPAR